MEMVEWLSGSPLPSYNDGFGDRSGGAFWKKRSGDVGRYDTSTYVVGYVVGSLPIL